MAKKSIIIYGPPGAGKGTQAELLSRKFGLFHFDTGRYLENKIYNTEKEGDLEWEEAKKQFESGELVNTKFVLRIVKEATSKMADAGMDIVYSGSPRTEYEAFGDENTPGLMNLLSEKYGKENIHIIHLDISEEETMARNSTRRVCSVCGLPILAESKLKTCALCGGESKVRTLDNPETIKIRIEEFKERTLPVIKRMKDEGYSVYKIDGSPPPYKVHEKITEVLEIKK